MYEHLLESTSLDDTQTNYMLGLGVELSDLTDEEINVYARSKAYRAQKHLEDLEKWTQKAKKAFEEIRDIPNMPERALEVLKRFTTRDEDYEDYDDE